MTAPPSPSATAPDAHVPTNLWQQRAFVIFWASRTISLSGSLVTAVALPVLVFRLTQSALLTALITAFPPLAYLVFGLFAGAMGDRVDRKRVMIACDLARGVLLSSVPVAALLGVLTLTQLFAVALISAVLFVWADAANWGALPALVGRERLVTANSILFGTGSTLQIVVPSLAGGLTALLDPALLLGLDAASFFGSALGLFAITVPFNASAQPARSGARLQRLGADIREGLQFIWQEPLVRTMTLAGFGTSLSSGAITGLLVVFAVQGLWLAPTDGRVGILFTAGAVGSLLTAALLPRLSRRLSVGRITLMGLLLAPLLTIGLALAPTFVVGCALYVLWSACTELIVLNGINLRQIVTPDALLSRVNTSARMIAWGGAPFGATIGGLLAEATTIRIAYALMALGVAAGAVVAWFSPLRTSGAVQLVRERLTEPDPS